MRTIIAILFFTIPLLAKSQSVDSIEIKTVDIVLTNKKLVESKKGYHIWSGDQGKVIYKIFTETTIVTVLVNGYMAPDYSGKVILEKDHLMIPIFLKKGEPVVIGIDKSGNYEQILIIK